MEITIKDKTYELATSLRVAYKVQGQHNHKSYVEVFKGVADMPIEDQIGIIYCAFQVKNPEDAKFISPATFLDYFLDNFDVGFIMQCLQSIVEGIMGKELTEKANGTEVGNA